MPNPQPKRCAWVNIDHLLMREYHDREWGVARIDKLTADPGIIRNRMKIAADAFSRDLKRRGFSFVGSTVIYGHMQAVGMVNDHLIDCFRYREVRRLGVSRK
jgi:3-methyladenine DNA glycosylase Tag